ncbi:hypothetical protein [Methylobacterium nigriterrae]|uniref:hypothetical protein n=1 Tax=Methylobacterium nigriterrae TaxID=3127512 RepID=UPI0030131FBC
MRLLPTIIWIFALASLLWFAASFISLALALFGQPAKSPAHALYGYAVATVQIAAVLGWLWALYASIQNRTAVNGSTQVMCGATAAAQVSVLLATVALIGGWLPDGRANLFVWYALVSALLMA